MISNYTASYQFGQERSLLFSNLIHQLIDLIQQTQTSSGILGPGNPLVDAPGDLIDVIADMMNLRAQLFDLLGWTGLDLCP